MSTNFHQREYLNSLDVTSPEFEHWSYIPKKYTSEGKNINPPLKIQKIPKETKSLILMIEDPEGPLRARTHWLVWNIDPESKVSEMKAPGIEGLNDFRSHQYVGPCSPGLRYYYFKVYALDTLLSLGFDATSREVELQMAGHMLAFGLLVGLYNTKRKNASLVMAQKQFGTEKIITLRCG